MTIWTEKYRPQSFEEMVGQEHIIPKLHGLLKNGEMPHLMFAGPAGVGKTTAALIIAKQLYGKGWRSNFLELNASDERGIDVIRMKVKDFARTKPLGNFPFKIIMLDEADSLTRDAQQALRRTMENYSRTCRFVLSCNYSTKIIDPIQSRCAIFRFKPIKKSELDKYLKKIAKNEKLLVEDDAFDAIHKITEGDCRSSVNLLQTTSTIHDTVDLNAVYEAANYAQPKQLINVLLSCREGNFLNARNELMKIMLEQGLSALDVLKQLSQRVFDVKLDEQKKMEILRQIGETEFRVVEGSDEFVQLQSLLASITLIMK
jgi:replication factor C small subunit